MKKVTAGRDGLNEFAPKFAELNDDILFGEVWSREEELSARDRSLVTVTALMAQGLCDSSFEHHLKTAKENGITKSEIAEILTHAAFYSGWPKAWAAFRLAKNIWNEPYIESEKQNHANSMIFPIGEPNTAFSKYFIGQSYLAQLSKNQVGIFNVTFEPSCRNNWHIHKADKGGGQILICVAGKGYYQEWGKDAQILLPGDTVNIAPDVKHWHGAVKDSWFSHLAIEVPGENTKTEWCERVTDEEYLKLK
ncbi:MAG: carboxymuconolactone decarboxylase family protein [Acutalibacteraceae bacterium]